MRATTLTVGALASASANNIALSQTPSSAFTLNGALVTSGVAILDTPRRVLFTFAGADVGKLITITGTSDGSSVQSEVVTAVSSGSTYTALDFKTVTAISTATALAAAVTVGTNGVASSRWMRMDEWIGESAGIQCTASGTVNYTVQGTMQDPNSPTNPVAAYLVTWNNINDTTLVGATATASDVTSVLPVYLRVLLNSGSGSVSTVISQASTGGGGAGGSGGSTSGLATEATLQLVLAQDTLTNTLLSTPAAYLPLPGAAASGDTTLTHGIPAAITTATTTALVTATASQFTRVYRMILTCTGTNTLVFKSASTAITQVFTFPSTGGTLTLDFSGYSWFSTLANEALNLTTTTTATVTMDLYYIKSA